MLVAIILAAVAILGGIAVVAMGFGGELALTARDEHRYPYLQTAEDVAAYRPPAALLGYDARATEHALRLAGQVIADRDAEIAALSDRLHDRAAARELPDDDEAWRPPAAGQSTPGTASPRVSAEPRFPAGPWPAPQQPMSAAGTGRWESRLAEDRTDTPGPVTLREEEK